jgi:type II pantothenate kinase
MPPTTLSPFCLLADPSNYVSAREDLRKEQDNRVHWIEFFRRHIHTLLKLSHEAGLARDLDAQDLERRAKDSLIEYEAILDRFLAEPMSQDKPVTIMTLDRWRDGVLRKRGFVDAFIDLKNRENAKMLPLLPAVCRELDALHGPKQLHAVVEGVFAGNIFDMGAEETARKFLSHSPDFFNTRASLPKRPWLVDDYDKLEQCLLHKIYRKCVFFVDNAGSDFLLGALPMIRWLAQRGTRVVLAANERPSLNDMTIDDVRTWWPRIIEAESSFSSLPIELVSSGTGEPLIDLLEVSHELNDAAKGADLLILEGMGRGVMSNFDASFTCDALNIAMIKDEWVARRFGGKTFDLVCRFR